MGFRVFSLGFGEFRVWGLTQSLGFGVYGLGSLGFEFSGLGFGSIGFGVWGVGGLTGLVAQYVCWRLRFCPPGRSRWNTHWRGLGSRVGFRSVVEKNLEGFCQRPTWMFSGGKDQCFMRVCMRRRVAL